MKLAERSLIHLNEFYYAKFRKQNLEIAFTLILQLMIYYWLKTSEVEFFRESFLHSKEVPSNEFLIRRQKYFHWIRNGIDILLAI